MPPGQQQQNQSDNSLSILWILAALFIFGAAIWILFRPQLVTAFFKIKIVEIYFIDLFTSQLNVLADWMRQADPSAVTMAQVRDISSSIGQYLRYPFVALLLLFACALYFGNSAGKYRKIYTMESLKTLECVNWPQINPVISLDLINEDIYKGPWAMAMTPMQFAKKHKILVEHVKPIYEGQLRKEAKTEVTLKRGDANRLFSLQVGPLWPGAHRLNMHTKALFSVFAARINNDTKSAEAILQKINLSASGKKLDFSGVNMLCRKYQNSEKVVKVIHKHAYVYTVMAGMLQTARGTGVLASADFLWLKPLDRQLWYVLNAAGRQTPCVEVAGAYAHWVAEKEISRPLVVPMVSEATKALEIAIREIVYDPERED